MRFDFCYLFVQIVNHFVDFSDFFKRKIIGIFRKARKCLLLEFFCRDFLAQGDEVFFRQGSFQRADFIRSVKVDYKPFQNVRVLKVLEHRLCRIDYFVDFKNVSGKKGKCFVSCKFIEFTEF